MNDMVLDIESNNISPGTKVIMYHENGQDNQLWYHDIYAGVIRSKANHDFVLDIEDGDLVINPYDPDNESQKFGCGGPTVYRLSDEGQVLDVAENNTDAGARVCLYHHHGESNQCWNLNHKDREYFLIRSDLNGLVLDIASNNTDEGAEVIMYEENGGDNQQWYEDEHNIICSKLNGMVLDASSGEFTMSHFDRDNGSQGFSFEDNKVVNLNCPDQCMDIKNADTEPNAKLCMYGYKASDNQHWSKQYL